MTTNFTQIIAAFVPAESSRTALKHAKDLAQRHQAKLTIVNVNSDKTDEKLVKAEVEDIMKDTTISYELIAKTGKPFREILALEKLLKANLIVIGTHGSHGRDPDWIGGNAFKILSGSRCPVLTFTPEHNKFGFKNIILPIADASETRQKVPLTIALAKAYNAKVNIVIVNKNEDPSVINTLKIYASQAEGYCIKGGVEYGYKEIYNKNIADACLDYAKEIDADLIAIMSERESPTGFFMGHYAQKLINSSTVSILTVHFRDTNVGGGSGY